LFLCCVCFVVATFICMFCIFITYSTSYCCHYKLMDPHVCACAHMRVCVCNEPDHLSFTWFWFRIGTSGGLL
jgi:hypothetical protein